MSSINATLGLKLGDISAAVNQLSDQVRTQLEPLDDVNKSFAKLRSSLSPLAPYASAVFGAVKVAAATAAAGAAAALGGIALSIGKAAQTETLETAFVPLLGGIDQAKARIQELSEFAAATPFELPEIAKASTVLETLTKGALSTGEGLKMVGDVAATTNQPFEEIAMQIGRMYDGLNNGRPVGQAMMRLQELGVISADTRSQIESLQQSGKKGDEVWQVAAQALGRFSGAMEAQSGTWNGMLSNLQDNIDMTLSAFGAPIMDALKPYLAGLADWIDTIRDEAAALGESIASGVNFVGEALRSGMFWAIAQKGLQYAFLESVNYLVKLLAAAISATATMAIENIKNSIAMLAVVTQADFWKGAGLALLGIASQFGNKLIDFDATFICSLEWLPGVGDQLRTAGETMRSITRANEQDTQAVTGMGLDLLRPAMETMRGRSQEQMQNIGQSFTAALRSAPDMFGTKELATEISALGAQIQSRAVADANTRAQERRDTLNKLGGKPTPTDGVETADAGKNKPSASRLISIGNYGIFVKDPLLAEARSQTKLLEEIAENTRKQGNSDWQAPVDMGDRLFA